MHLLASDPSSTDVSWKPAAVFPQEAGKQFPAHSTIQLEVSGFVFLKKLPNENMLPVLLLSIQREPEVPLMHNHQVSTHHPQFQNKPRTCITFLIFPFLLSLVFSSLSSCSPHPQHLFSHPAISTKYMKVRLPNQLKAGLTKALLNFSKLTDETVCFRGRKQKTSCSQHPVFLKQTSIKNYSDYQVQPNPPEHEFNCPLVFNI